MTSSLQRIRRGAVLLGTVIVVAVFGYRFFGDYDWIGALWMVVVTVASVGYGERSTLPPAMQLFTIGVILVGVSAAAYTFGGVVEMMLEGELEKVLGSRRVSREIERLSGHVVLCGFGRIGQLLAADLKRQSTPFVVIEQAPQNCLEAQSRGYLTITGDATEEEVLIAGGIQRAKTLVTGLNNDAANVFITLTGRNLNPTIQIIARAEHRTTERKLIQAGANRVVLPASTGASQMARMITRPSTADVMAIVSQTGGLAVEMDELQVGESSRLVGLTVRDSDAHRKYGLLVVAVKQTNDEFVFNPHADYRFQSGDIIIIIGRAEDVSRFRAELKI